MSKQIFKNCHTNSCIIDPNFADDSDVHCSNKRCHNIYNIHKNVVNIIMNNIYNIHKNGGWCYFCRKNICESCCDHLRKLGNDSTYYICPDCFCKYMDKHLIDFCFNYNIECSNYVFLTNLTTSCNECNEKFLCDECNINPTGGFLNEDKEWFCSEKCRDKYEEQFITE